MKRVAAILNEDVERSAALDTLHRHGPPDAWIGAGYIRDAVWDRLHGRIASPPVGDVDIIWFDRVCVADQIDREWEARLRDARPDLRWSVKNQARMHVRNGDGAYMDISAAVSAWPETATAIAARRNANRTEILAPLGCDDLFNLILRPTSRFMTERRAIFDLRVSQKAWLQRYPLLQLLSNTADRAVTSLLAPTSP